VDALIKETMLVAVETIVGASVVLNDADRRLVAELENFLREHQHDGVEDTIMLATADGQQQSLPHFLVRALHMLTTLLAQGDDVALVPVHKELTTYEAAALLNVSRPFLIKLLDEGIIPSTKVGTHRRVLLRDVLEYGRRRSEKNKRLLDEILSFAQKQGGYD
jgi:excisionase family DNA binding protein